MTMDKQLVWVRDGGEGFILARLQELMGEECDVFPLDNKHPRRTVNFDDIFPAGDPAKDVDDNCELMFLNEATLLNNMLLRYKKRKIYTYVANILLAVNPYEDIPDMYSPSTIKKYQGRSLGELPPHVFAIANPILEAFGNAKTTRNNNSSRFGKFMEVHFSAKYQVVGGFISHYLLEKSRICTQSAEERNYHVFYLLCAGAPQELRAALKITKPDDYLNGCTQYFTTPQSAKKISASQMGQQHQKRGGLRDPILDDVEDFQRLHQISVYSIVAAVLHLGNIEFEEEGGPRGGCKVCPNSEGTLQTAASLLGIEAGELRMSLVSRLMQSSRGGMKGTAIISMYHFEYFEQNSFEQFCINYCNEKLQQFFNERILKNEQELQSAEVASTSQDLDIQNSQMTTAMIHSFGLSDKDYKFGVTRVFFRPGKYSEFDSMMRSDPENLQAIVGSVLAWLVKKRWRRAAFSVLSIIKCKYFILKNKILYRRECLIRVQKSVRGYLVRRQHKPRYQGIIKIKALENNLREMETVTAQLKKDKDSAKKNIENLRNNIKSTCSIIKVS
ncbi:unnamed protein product [Leptidea sinapis]|uniref:Myosin motor domain-containing protein n=1 Tax=Leptidea sinapis TaxID=189913 RepID=A0A5E4QE36_9NEOP|nr:unnamed protein product [Leptidea sinapis]